MLNPINNLSIYLRSWLDWLLLQERGKCKEEEFLKKVQQTVEEEEKQRIPIAQGLPWTTEEPEVVA